MHPTYQQLTSGVHFWFNRIHSTDGRRLSGRHLLFMAPVSDNQQDDNQHLHR